MSVLLSVIRGCWWILFTGPHGIVGCAADMGVIMMFWFCCCACQSGLDCSVDNSVASTSVARPAICFECNVAATNRFINDFPLDVLMRRLPLFYWFYITGVGWVFQFLQWDAHAGWWYHYCLIVLPVNYTLCNRCLLHKDQRTVPAYRRLFA